MKKVKVQIIICFLLIMGIIMLFSSFVLIKKSTSNYKQDSIKYNEKNNIDYKVYIKPNEFFTEKYLGKGNLYITSLIDYLEIDFQYNTTFDKEISGKYKYLAKAIVSTGKEKNGNFWSKEYEIIPEETVNYTKQKQLLLNKNIKIDYQFYNDLLLKFKKNYHLSADASLKIILNVENIIDSKIVKDKLNKKTEMTLTIPLTGSTIEVPIDTVDGSKNSSINSEKVLDTNNIYKKYKLIGILLICLTLIDIVFIIKIIIKRAKSEDKFKKKVKKILKTYDEIIVNVQSLPNIENLNVINVTKFNELVDAYNEVHKPINFIQEKDKVIFLLINDNFVWQYNILKESENQK